MIFFGLKAVILTYINAFTAYALSCCSQPSTVTPSSVAGENGAEGGGSAFALFAQNEMGGPTEPARIRRPR